MQTGNLAVPRICHFLRPTQRLQGALGLAPQKRCECRQDSWPGGFIPRFLRFQAFVSLILRSTDSSQAGLCPARCAGRNSVDNFGRSDRLANKQPFAKLVAPHESLRGTEPAKEVEDFAVLERVIVRGYRPNWNCLNRLVIDDAVAV